AGDPSILLLDEATSALDGHAETQVRDALARVRADRTTLIIAHRLSTLQHAQKVLVFEHGRLVRVGTHAELARDSETYRRLFAAEAAAATPRSGSESP